MFNGDGKLSKYMDKTVRSNFSEIVCTGRLIETFSKNPDQDV